MAISTFFYKKTRKLTDEVQSRLGKKAINIIFKMQYLPNIALSDTKLDELQHAKTCWVLNLCNQNRNIYRIISTTHQQIMKFNCNKRAKFLNV